MTDEELIARGGDMDAPAKWEFDGPWQAAFVDGLSGKWLRLSLNGRSVASYEVAAWGSEQACIEAAWRYAYEPQDEPAPDLAGLVEAITNLPAIYAHQINTGVREVYDPLQRFYTMESVLAALAMIKETKT